MEKRIKIEAVNGEIVLPEAIIHHIPSFLNGKQAARTSILSKSWSTRPNLDFNHRDIEYFANRCGIPRRELSKEVCEPEDISEEFKKHVTDIEATLLNERKIRELVTESDLSEAGLALPLENYSDVESHVAMKDDFPSMRETNLRLEVTDKGGKGKGVASSSGVPKKRPISIRRSETDEPQTKRRNEVRGSTPTPTPTVALPLPPLNDVQTGSGSGDNNTYFPEALPGVDVTLLESKNLPPIYKEYYRQGNLTTFDLDKLPDHTKDALGYVAKAWLPSEENMVSNLGPHEMFVTGMTHIGRALSYLTWSNDFHTREGNFMSKMAEGTMVENEALKAQVAELKCKLVVSEKTIQNYKKKAEAEKVGMNEKIANLEVALDHANTELKAAQAKAEKAVEEYRMSDENEYLMNRSFAVAYRHAIQKIEKEYPEFDTKGLKGYVQKYCQVKGVKDLSGYEVVDNEDNTQAGTEGGGE